MLGDGGRPGTEGVRNRFSRTFSLYDDPDTQSQVLRFIFGRTGTSVYFLNQGRFQRKKMGKCENFSQVGDTPPIKMLTGNGTKRWRWLGLVMALSICIGNIFSSRLSDRKCQVEVRDRQKCHQQVNIQM